MLIAEGSFGARRLVGTFRLPTRELERCEDRHSCLFFSGMIELGGIGGWPEGLGTTCTISLAISPCIQVSRGVYHIGALPGMDIPQYGRLDLKINDR